jgi:TonB-dependent receptor
MPAAHEKAAATIAARATRIDHPLFCSASGLTPVSGSVKRRAGRSPQGEARRLCVDAGSASVDPLFDLDARPSRTIGLDLHHHPGSGRRAGGARERDMRITARVRTAFITSASLIALNAASAAWAQPASSEPGVDNATGQLTPVDSAIAPNAAAAEDDAIVVTGFRESLSSALNVKRNESGIVDVIKAEDIAAFPDLNLAESLQRIPGVAISREAGEGRQISVRGLGPDYTRVRLNGIEALATSGSSDSGGGSGTNRGRGFDFNIFASELFNALTVRKSASADVEEGSLGATVDLQTGRPFDYKKPTFVVSGQLGYNDLRKKVDPRVAVVASRTFAEGKLGALVSVAYGERHIQQQGFGTTRWDNGPSQTGFCSPVGADNPNVPGVQSNPAAGGANCGNGGPPRLPGTPENIANYNLASAPTTFLPRIPSYNKFDLYDRRLGVTGSFQAAPTDQTLITLDLLYARLKQSRDERAMQAIGLSRSTTGKPQTTIRAIAVDENNNLVSATMDNVDMRTQTRIIESGTEFKQGTLSLSHEFSDRVRVSALAGRARSRFDTSNDTTITFDQANVQNYQIDFSKNDRVPMMSFNLDPTQPASWTAINGTSEVRLRPGYVVTKFDTLKADLAFDIYDGLTLKVGGDDRVSRFNSVEFRRNSETAIQTLTPQQIADFSQLTTGYGRMLGLPAGSPTSFISPDVAKYAAGIPIYSNSGIWSISSELNSSARGNTSFVREHNRAAFGMLDFRFDLGGIHFRGDAGVRYVETRQRSTGYAARGTTVELVTVDRAYHNILPSTNLSADLAQNLVLRFAMARTIARPSLGSLSPGGDVSVQGANRTFSTGNPFINPTKTTNVDLGLEYYPQRGALYGIGLFYKDISTFAQTLRTSAIYNTLGLPAELLIGTGAQVTEEFAVTRPIDSPGGKLKGVEINVQQPLTFLPGLLRNFGILANYTYVSSRINYLTSTTAGDPTIPATLIGLSKHTANGTLYYEDDKFSVRGSVAYRSGYLTSVPGRNNNAIEGTNSTFNVDARVSYEITDQLEISVEGINLTNQADDQYVDFTNRVNAYRVSGRQFYLGARFRF